MKKVFLKPRENWQQKCVDRGFLYHSVDGRYWVEEYAIEFTQKEMDKLEKAASEIHSMCHDMASETIRTGNYSQYHIPDYVCEMIEKSWKQNDFSMYGRFDFSFDGKGFPKLFEYNADTAQSIVESAIVQSDWLFDRPEMESCGQFNKIDQMLFEVFKKWPTHQKLFFAVTDLSTEEYANVLYLKNAAQEAGVNTEIMFLKDVFFDEEKKYFFNVNTDEKIDYLFKYYPWEYIIKEPIFFQIEKSNVQLIEPAWKMLFATKAILPLLWQKHPNHPNLLESYFSNTSFMNHKKNFVQKPIYSREGMNTVIYEFENDELVEKDFQKGFYGSEGLIYQERKDCVQFDGRYNMIAMWMIDQKPAGISIREDQTIITKDTCLFIPHYIKD